MQQQQQQQQQMQNGTTTTTMQNSTTISTTISTTTSTKIHFLSPNPAILETPACSEVEMMRNRPFPQFVSVLALNELKNEKKSFC